MADTAICHVVDPAGKPISNAAVYLIMSPTLDKSVPDLTTDKSGNFTVDNILDTDWRLCMIDAAGFAPSGGQLIVGDNTFTLCMPTKLTGKVVDSKGRSAAGVTVCAEYALISGMDASNKLAPRCFSYFMIDPFASRYTVKTDLTGQYALDDLPANSQVIVQTKDPRYAVTTVTTVKGASEAPVLTAEVGTSISGKVIRQDGKPIRAGLQVFAASSGKIGAHTTPSIAKVAPDGSYTITGILPDSYTVTPFLNSTGKGAEQDWLRPAPVKVTASIETPGVAPDLVLESGAIVTGSVLEAGTKKPVPNVGVSFENASNKMATLRYENATTDADGIFKVQLSAGKSVVKIWNLPDDYLSDPDAQQITVTAVADQTVTMAPLLLKRAEVVTGTAVDDSGKPVPNVVLLTQKLDDDDGWINVPAATTSNSGDFSIHHLVAGKFWIDAGAAWSVVSPKSFTVPLTTPIKLVLKRNATAAVQGTVVDTTKAPVAGVDVSFYIEHPTAVGFSTTSNVDVTTGSDGTYTLPDAPLDPNVLTRTNVTRDGYVFKCGGDVIALNGKVIVSPIIICRLNGKVTGVVYNSLGKPVAGAWITSPDNGNGTAPVQTDATGHFELLNLPVGSADVYAGKCLFFSHATLQASTTPAQSAVRLSGVPTVQTGPASLSKVTAMLTKIINSQLAKKDHDNEGNMRAQAAHIIAELSPDAAVSFILSASSITTSDLGHIASARAYSDPVGIAGWALVPIKRISDTDRRGQRGATAAAIGLAAALYDPAAAAPYYDIAAQYIHFDKLRRSSIANSMTLTALAYLLHRPEAEDDYAKVSAGLNALVKNLENDSNGSYDSVWIPQNLAKIIALGNVDKAIAMLKAMPARNRYNNVSEIIAELVKPNPAGALAIYHWIVQEPPSIQLPWAQGRALCRVLPIIYKTDPKGAVEKAHSITDPGDEAQALTDLADLMPLTEASPLYMEAEDKAIDRYGNGYSPACVASHAWQRDQVLGRKLFKTAYTKFVADIANTSLQFGQVPSCSDFAFYYARIDPAYCRLLLESHFVKDDNAIEHVGGDSAAGDVAAMSAIDISRAAEMAMEIKSTYTSYSAGLKPAQYLLLTPQQRNAIPFSDWVNNSDWVPGMPSN